MAEGLTLIAQGWDVRDLLKVEELIREGEMVQVRLYLQQPLAQSEIEQLQEKLREKRAVLSSPITQVSSILAISFRKEIAPLLLLVPLISGLSIFGWQVFKRGFAQTLTSVVGLTIIGVGLFLIVRGVLRGR